MQGEASSRGDRMAWVDGSDRWAAMRSLAHSIDGLVGCIHQRAVGVAGRIGSRMAPMVSRYEQGAAFARHADNHCLRGRGSSCDARVLTAVYYLSSDDWNAPADGGCLRFYRP